MLPLPPHRRRPTLRGVATSRVRREERTLKARPGARSLRASYAVVVGRGHAALDACFRRWDFKCAGTQAQRISTNSQRLPTPMRRDTKSTDSSEILTRALGPRRGLATQSACLSPSPRRDATQLRGLIP